MSAILVRVLQWRLLAWLSDEQLWALSFIMSWMLILGHVPACLALILIHLIPKPKGGKRPIGLVDGLCRLWEEIRRPIMTTWRSGLWPRTVARTGDSLIVTSRPSAARWRMCMGVVGGWPGGQEAFFYQKLTPLRPPEPTITPQM